MPKSLLALVLFAPLIQGCVAAALGVGAGLVVSQDVLDNNTYVAHLNVDVNRTWASVKTSMSHASLKPMDVDNDVRKVTAEVDGAKVIASVETYDLNRSVVNVSAKKYGVSNGEIAKMVLDKILNDLEK